MSSIPSPLTAREIEMLTGTDPTTWWPSTTTGSPLTTVAFPTGALGSYSLEGQRRKIVADLVDDGYWVKMTGSRVTKDGWTNESDWDYVVYDPDHKFANTIDSQEWVLGSNVDAGEFMSIRKNDVNLILVDKEEIWKKYIIAANLIKTLNSKTKGERVAVFDSVFGKDSNAKALEF